MSDTFDGLRFANLARQGEWDPQGKLSETFLALALAGEAGEVCNVVKKLERERLGLKGSRATREQLADEIADVVIYADLLASAAGLDLGAAVRAKFNATSAKLGLRTRFCALCGEPAELEPIGATLCGDCTAQSEARA